MTNKQYHRRRRALERLERDEGRPVAEYRRVLSLVSGYRSGGLRAKNGRGSGLHTSGAQA